MSAGGGVVWLGKQLGLGIAFQIIMMLIYIGVLVIIWDQFLTWGAAQLASAFGAGSFAGMTTNILATMLPSNTTTIIGLTLSTDLAVIGLKRTLSIMTIKRNFLGQVVK